MSTPLPTLDARANRQFALLIAVALPVLCAVFWSWQAAAWSLLASIGVLVVGWLQPASLTPANRAWHKLGLLLGRIVTPVVMSVVFVVGVVPVALARKALRKRSFHMGALPDEDSYWIKREPGSPRPEQIRQQF